MWTGLGLWLLAVAGALRGALWLVGYIGGNAFPQPLSEAEEQSALAAMREGDGDARRRLIEHNLRLVAHVVKKYNNKGVESDDLISIGTVGLIKGVDTFNADKGTRLATYCARCIENEKPLTLHGGKYFLMMGVVYSRDIRV